MSVIDANYVFHVFCYAFAFQLLSRFLLTGLAYYLVENLRYAMCTNSQCHVQGMVTCKIKNSAARF